ncbi:hypothetical protein EC973_003429 [Apophysomyces ossiformis]|uniref:Uncharacterized protein n=1 Tax=Apophysomyces ossiformis TaxID=679940 RepID=A0A8H7EL68_9FUNG|nr:hypothetical protein EC973_003429 [Apophysomyces ossiformis]
MPYIPGVYLHHFHLYLIPAEIVWLYASYYIACNAEPGTITSNNVQSYLDHFPYDNLLYHPKECQTCKLQKLYLVGRGITTNEAFKWDMIEEDIQRGVLWQYEEQFSNKAESNVRKRTSSKVSRDTVTSKVTKKRIASLEELDNIYDAGFFQNLLDVFVPPKLGKP